MQAGGGVVVADVQEWLEQYYGVEGAAIIVAALAVPPPVTTLRVNTLRCSPEEALLRLREHFAQAPKDVQDLLQAAHVSSRLPDCLEVPCVGPNEVQPGYPEITVDTKARNSHECYLTILVAVRGGHHERRKHLCSKTTRANF